MFYHILFPLRDYLSGLNLFRYISFRAVAAAVTALLLSFVIGPWLIKRLKRSGVVETIRPDGPATHQKKAGTPTMGGWIILLSLLGGTLLFARLDHPHIWVVVLATVWMAIVGFVDDWLKHRGDKNGLIPRYKLLGQITLGLLIGIILYFFPEYFSTQFADNITKSTLPFFKNKFLPFAPWGLWPLYILMVVLVITATSNSVNLTDGLDGLAIGVVGIMAVGMAFLAYVTGHVVFSGYLNIVYLPGSGELTVYCAALAGSALGFLWWNTYPAQVTMGDTGALALGAGLATVAILLMKELFLVMLGGILVAESLSVLAQRYYFKYTRIKYGQGRRVLLKAPLHHHFELLGWPETQVTVRFWIISILLLAVTLVSFKIR